MQIGRLYKLAQLIGNRYGDLMVIGIGERKGKYSTMICKCKCGSIKQILTHSLKDGATQSCGCLQKKLAKIRQTTHGMKYTPFYRRWRGMVSRCGCPSGKYKELALGHEPRRKYFTEFYKDMYSSYFEHVKEYGEKDTTLDRHPNQLGGYMKDNVRWATRKEQCNNRTTNKYVYYLGQKMNLHEFAGARGLSYPKLLRIMPHEQFFIP